MLVTLLVLYTAELPGWRSPDGRDGGCRTPGDNTGSYDELWELSLTGCADECLAYVDCVAIEYTQVPPHYKLCELHKDMPTHTVPVSGSACLLRPSERHTRGYAAKPMVNSQRLSPPPPPVVKDILTQPVGCLARGCKADGSFVDEFDGALLDRSAWNVRVDPVDPGTGTCGTNNNEDQCYVDDPDHVFVRDGRLHIVARRAANGRITSARIHTRDKVEMTYGRWEARLKVPAVVGTLPAFWTIGFDYPLIGWPACGEIDIMENFQHGSKGADARRRWTSTVHSIAYHGGGRSQPLDLTQFHTVRLDWSPDALQFYVDNKPTWRYDRKPGSTNDDWPFAKPHFVILNLAIGGNGVGGHLPPVSAYPLTYVVEYVSIEPLAATHSGPICTTTRKANVQCLGNDIRDVGLVSSGGACCHACHSTVGCSAWTWNHGYDGHCWVKTSCASKQNNPKTESGF
mmetsp:Transcript_37704/g.88216  ORF Transcript_37704/g.88216 Transcript_37704/m.88216 type:complete len:457 (-) Transcript_37704:27-1397(-)